MRRSAKISAPATPPQARRRRIWLPLGLSAIAVAIGLASGVAWRRNAHVMHVQAGLPAAPDLAGQPAPLGEKLAQATLKTQSRRTLIDGVVDLGRLYHANGFNREAEACWRIMRAEQPDEAHWCYYLADLRRAAGDYDGMEALLNKTIELAPDYSSARLLLANLQFKSGDLDHAEANYRLRLAQMPRDPYSRLGIVRLAIQKGRREEARTLLVDLLKDAPDFSTAHNLYAEILAADGDAAGAKLQRWLGAETIRYADATDPWLDELMSWCYDYHRLCVSGTREFQREDHHQARALFERAIQLEPDQPDAYELLSALLLKEDRPDDVAKLIERALPHLIRSKSQILFIDLAQSYQLLKRLDDAEKTIRRGFAAVGDTAELRDALGLVLADQGRHEAAVEMFQSALARNPNDAAMNYHLAVSFLALGRLDETLAALDRSLTLQPAFAPTLVLRGRIEMAAGHWDQVEAYLRPVFETHPDNADARRSLAEWDLHMGADAESKNDPAAAERYYRDGLVVSADNAELCVSLGVFYLVHGRFADAVPPLEHYLRLQPENAQACLFLGQAYAASGRRDEARKVLSKGVDLAEAAANARAADFCRQLLQRL